MVTRFSCCSCRCNQPPHPRRLQRRLVLLIAGMLLLLGQISSAQAIPIWQINPVDSGGVGWYTALALDATGYPVISYFDFANLDLKLVHCNDLACSGHDEQIQTLDSAGQVGYFTSLALDATGYPVISYAGTGTLKLLHCNDVNCRGNDESIETVDDIGYVGAHTSLRLDAAGYPVISYQDFTNRALKLVHCNDANCAGNDEHIQTVVSTAVEIQFTSLVLDGTGHPVISYLDAGTFDLRLVHCNDVNCSGNDEQSQIVDNTNQLGQFNTLALDAAGYPVISYWDSSNNMLKLAHCNDADCRGNDEQIQIVDNTRGAGQHTALALDGAGNPVISYQVMDQQNVNQRALKLVHCNDPDCRGNDEQFQIVDDSGQVGRFSALVLDAADQPVISYADDGNGALKLARLIDDPPPTVTINQAPTQADPTSSAPINFMVTFNEPVIGFTSGDVTLGGSAGATTLLVTELAPSDGTLYAVAVSGMTQSGTIIATINAGVATDGMGNGNLAATSSDNTVTYFVEAPGVLIDHCGGFTVRQLNGRYVAAGWNGAIKVGTNGNNTLVAANGPTLLLGLGGNDLLRGQGGDDLLCGGDGVDLLQGFDGNDLLDGGNGNDVLNGGRGDYDQLLAGAGHDVLLDGDGVSTAAGGAGHDLFTLVLRHGWLDANGQPRFAGLTAGYGNDRVVLVILHRVRFVVEISGDERDDPAGPQEGNDDRLAFAGLLDPASTFSKFEQQLVLSAEGIPASPDEAAGAAYLTEAVGEEAVGSDGTTRLFLPLVTDGAP